MPLGSTKNVFSDSLQNNKLSYHLSIDIYIDIGSNTNIPTYGKICESIQFWLLFLYVK